MSLGSAPRVTVTALARCCGVSVATVSNVLNGKGSYRSATRERIQAAAERLGYQTNASAKAMVTGRFGCQALLLSPRASASLLPFGLIEALDEALALNGKHLIVSRLPDDQLTSPGFVPKILSHMLADGLIINYNISVPIRLQELLVSSRVPAVWINRDVPNNAILHDDLAAGRSAAERLLAAGHRRVGWIDLNNGPDNDGLHYSQLERRAGVRQVLQAAGLTCIDIGRNGGLKLEDRVPWLAARLRDEGRPSAVVCYASEAASSLMIAALSIGLVVPDDVSLAVIHDRPFMLGSLLCDTWALDAETLGRLAVQRLDALIDTGEVHVAIRVPLLYRPGASIVRPRT